MQEKSRMIGYYIHNQQKDGSGVSKKIDAQMKVFKEHFVMHELILEKKKENKIQRKLRQRIFKQRPKMLYDKALKKINTPDFVYVRKQILDKDFLNFLESIKRLFPDCKVLMEVPTYPYWNEYPKNKLGAKIIEQEKMTIPLLKDVVDLIVDVGNEKNLFGISTINIQNGLDPDEINLSSKKEKSSSVNLIAVAKWRDVHGYERIIDSLREYYQKSGEREIVLHMVGDGPETDHYMMLVDNDLVRDKVVFYGFKTGVDLEKIYDKADMGLGVFGFYKTGGTYVSAIKCAEYLMRGIPVISAVEETYLKELEGKCYLGFPDNDSTIDMEKIIQFYDRVYSSEDIEQTHQQIRNIALKCLSISTVMEPVVEWLEK